MKFEVEYIEKLAKLVAETGLTEISLEDGEQAITIRKDLPEVSVAPQAYAAPVAQVAAPTVAVTVAEAPKAEPAHKGTAIVSPMVGTFYASSSPDSAAFVEVGKTISQGDVVCIIEAMKLMNEIESEYSGTVVEICVKDGQPIEYGQALMYIE